MGNPVRQTLKTGNHLRETHETRRFQAVGQLVQPPAVTCAAMSAASFPARSIPLVIAVNPVLSAKTLAPPLIRVGTFHVILQSLHVHELTRRYKYDSREPHYFEGVHDGEAITFTQHGSIDNTQSSM
jgi:hypothetical protein